MGNIVEAIKNGAIFYRGWRFFRRKIPLYFVGNGNMASRCEQDTIYRTLKRKYRKTLEANIEDKFDETNFSSHRVWICWFQGYENAPPLVKACINSVNRNLPDWEVVILSDENIKEYVTLPVFIEKKRSEGIISVAHYSDLLRTELLCKFGGLWVDATVLCTAKNSFPKYISENDFFVFKSLELNRYEETPTVASSWLIYSSRPNNLILMKTRQLLHAYWRRERVLKDYFLFHIFFAMAARKFDNEWRRIPVFNNHSPHVMQFEFTQEFTERRWTQILNMSDFHKLNHHIDYEREGLSNINRGGVFTTCA